MECDVPLAISTPKFAPSAATSDVRFISSPVDNPTMDRKFLITGPNISPASSNKFPEKVNRFTPTKAKTTTTSNTMIMTFFWSLNRPVDGGDGGDGGGALKSDIFGF
jgi:hypothetical protein